MDTVSQFLVGIKNAMLVGKDKVDIPSSRMRVALATILKEKGWVKDFRLADDGKQGLMRIYLGSNSFAGNFLRVSKPSKRVYISKQNIKSVRSGRGFSILSTNVGVLSDDQARQRNVGGELICNIW